MQSCANDTDIYTVIPDGSSASLQSRIVDLYGTTSYLVLPHSQDFENIPSDPKNPLTDPKVTLGQLLFHETGLGIKPLHEEGSQTYSCASCHHSRAGFQSGLKQGIGEGGSGFGAAGEARVPAASYLGSELDVQPIRTPSILNTAFQELMLWNGQFGATGMNAGTQGSWETGTPKEANFLGFQGVETQAIAGMGVHRLQCDPEMISAIPYYKDLFDRAFPEVAPSARYSDTIAGQAIAAYERTVLSNQAPFQKWLRGDLSAMNEDQLQGALLFFGKAECYQCHSGPALNSMSFHALGISDFQEGQVIGMVDDATKKGRGGFTGQPADMYAFKTPTIYNLKNLAFLGHGGSFSSVEGIIRYKNLGIGENPEVPNDLLSPLFYPLGLSETEISQLTIFVEDALYDSNLERYVPDTLPSGNCFPVADPASREQLGCD